MSAEASAGAAKSRSMGDLPQWVCWRAELREGKATKVPYSPHSGSRARSDDLATFGTLSEAKRAAREGDYDGIGFVFTESDSFCGVDLDGRRPAGLRAGARHRQGSALTQAAIREACRRSTSLR